MRVFGRVGYDDRSDGIMPLAVGVRGGKALAAPQGPSWDDQVAYLSGYNANGFHAEHSYWSDYADAPLFKFGISLPGSGGWAFIAFDDRSKFTSEETATIWRALNMWSAVADVRFAFSFGGQDEADLLFKRGDDGGAYTTTPNLSGEEQTVVSIDTDVFGFDLSGSLTTAAGYGWSTIVHEIGHALGLGHAGPYNGYVDPSADQNSAYDNTQYTIMSYLSWADGDALRYGPPTGADTDWGVAQDGAIRTTPQTFMPIDIEAVQRIYGIQGNGPFTGGQHWGFKSNVTGSLAGIYDFKVNKAPVLTLFSTGTGNTLDLSGSTTANIIDVRPGAFSSVMGLVNNIAVARSTVVETVIGGKRDDVVYASDVDSVLSGLNGADTLVGGAGNDRLDGGIGADLLRGGRGDDSYVVDQAGDRIEEDTQGGSDTVLTALRWLDLAAFAEVENAQLTGRAGGVLIGTAADNRLTGGAGADELRGLAGADELIGGAGDDLYWADVADRITEAKGGGIDTVRIDAESYVLAQGMERLVFDGFGAHDGTGNAEANFLQGLVGWDVLRGMAGADVLIGWDGNDRLDGGAGADRMEGGLQDDTYLVDTAADRLIEARDGGTDTAIASADLVLPNFVENLQLVGGARAGTGNALANRIEGGTGADTLAGLDGADVLIGGKGADRLEGGKGDDVLTGGGGADRFVFAAGDTGRTPASADLIADFSRGDKDQIDLSGLGLRFIAEGAFGSAAGELRYVLAGGETLVLGDLNGDGRADLLIRLTGEMTMVAGDFLL